MALTFPNRSRSYDETEQRIRFRGYDGMFEVPFAVEVDALFEDKIAHVQFGGRASGSL